MRSLFSRLLYQLKYTLQRCIASFLIIQNQASIVELSQSNKRVYLEPVQPYKGTGSIEHYYHLIFDLILPLHRLLRRTNNTIFVLKDVGVLTEIIAQCLPKDRVEIVPVINKAYPLVGMTPERTYLNSSHIESLNQCVCTNLQIASSGKCNRILLIERLPPELYFTNAAAKKGSGASRRSIINHGELSNFLQAATKPGFRFSNLTLETMAIEEQVRYFSSACIVFAQHGAGLANCIWMKPGTIIVELGWPNTSAYVILSQLKRCHYFSYLIKKHHITLDIEHFSDWISQNQHLSKFFAQSRSWAMVPGNGSLK